LLAMRLQQYVQVGLDNERDKRLAVEELERAVFM
jgi:hypothetical protein